MWAFYPLLPWPTGWISGAVYAKSIELNPDIDFEYNPLETPLELPPFYPPTYVPGQTSFLEACTEALSEPIPPGNPEWEEACNISVQEDEFKRLVTEQIPGRNMGNVPPKIENIAVFPLEPVVPEGNAVVEVEFGEYLPVAVNFVWKREVKTLRDDGTGGDAVAYDGVYGAVIQADPEDFEEVTPAPLPAVSGPLVLGCGSPEEPNCDLHPEKVLMIRGLPVVENVERTQDPCLSINPGDGDKKWTFGYLLSQMLDPDITSELFEEQLRSAYSAFATGWLSNWNSFNEPVNGQIIETVFALNSEEEPVTLAGRLLESWNAASGGTGILDMNKAPFRLSAIVNRFDLRKNEAFGGGVFAGGELRFVFSPLDLRSEDIFPGDACALMGFPAEAHPESRTLQTVILEYAVDLSEGANYWAEKWQALDELDFGSPEYLTALEEITQLVVEQGRGVIFNGRPNGSALAQLRTNETTIGSTWDLREFMINPATGFLQPTTVNKAPADEFNESAELGQWISDPAIKAAVASDDPDWEVPDNFMGGYFQGAHSLNNPGAAGFWQPEEGFLDYSQYEDRTVRHKFSLNTCSGCHSKETRDANNPQVLGIPFFAHVMPREPGNISVLSSFLTGVHPSNPGEIVWVPDPVTAEGKHLWGAAWTGSELAAVGQSGYITLSDGLNQTDVPSGTENTLRSVLWGAGQLVAVGESGTILASATGTTWNVKVSGVPENLNSIAWSGFTYAAVGDNGVLVTSADGDSWNALYIAGGENLKSIIWAGSQFIMVGENEIIVTSSDGIHWAIVNSGMGNNALNSITSTGSHLIAVGENGVVYNSTDGTTWGRQVIGATLNSVTWSGSDLVAVGPRGSVFSSPSGVHWSPQNPGHSTDLNAIITTGVSGMNLLAVGHNNTILSAPNSQASNWSLASTDDRHRYFEDLFMRWEGLSEVLNSGSSTSIAAMTFQPSGRVH